MKQRNIRHVGASTWAATPTTAGVGCHPMHGVASTMGSFASIRTGTSGPTNNGGMTTAIGGASAAIETRRQRQWPPPCWNHSFPASIKRDSARAANPNRPRSICRRRNDRSARGSILDLMPRADLFSVILLCSLSRLPSRAVPKIKSLRSYL